MSATLLLLLLLLLLAVVTLALALAAVVLPAVPSVERYVVRDNNGEADIREIMRESIFAGLALDGS